MNIQTKFLGEVEIQPSEIINSKMVCQAFKNTQNISF